MVRKEIAKRRFQLKILIGNIFFSGTDVAESRTNKLQRKKSDFMNHRKSKALAKRMQHVGATSCNIVARNMLRAFGHHVAQCCVRLANPAQHDMIQQGCMQHAASVWPGLNGAQWL